MLQTQVDVLKRPVGLLTRALSPDLVRLRHFYFLWLMLQFLVLNTIQNCSTLWGVKGCNASDNLNQNKKSKLHLTVSRRYEKIPRSVFAPDSEAHWSQHRRSSKQCSRRPLRGCVTDEGGGATGRGRGHVKIVNDINIIFLNKKNNILGYFKRS